jgi:uncharacterized protein (DUF58 family)
VALTWDATVLSRVRHLHLRARILTESLMMGEHRSRRVGQAIEFADYQEYLPGMDLRRLDWRVYARTDRLVVRRYETETELPCSVVVDLSGDLGTGDSGRHGYPDLDRSKAGYAISLAATLLYFLHRHGEPVGLEIVAGEVPFRSFKPRTGRNHLQQMFLALAAARAGGVADLLPALGRAGGVTRRRSWVALISDGMEEPAKWTPALAAFARRGADFAFLHLHDEREWALDFSQPTVFFSPEGGEEIPVDPAGARGAFEDVVREYVAEVRAGVIRWGGRYLDVPTTAPMEGVLRTLILGEVVAKSWA